MAEQEFAVSCENIHALHIQKTPRYWSVLIELSPEGTRIFHEVTSNNLGDYLTISFEGRELLRTRVFESIESGFIGLRTATQAAASQLAHTICSSKIQEARKFPPE